MNTTTKNNIILCGFMASGKSRIGAMLAEKLACPLYDLDAIIEKSSGLSIKDIFAKKGELYFRGLELQAIKKLAKVENSIIVTGGGAPTFFDSLEALRSLGVLYYLDANFALILKRLKKSTKRPLGTLSSPEEFERLKRLYLFRRPLYMSIAHNIDVNHEDKERTCSEIREHFNAQKQLESTRSISVDEVQNGYEIFLGAGLLKHLNFILDYVGLTHHRAALVTSDSLAKTLKFFIDKMALTKSMAIITIKDGEQHKNAESIEHIHRSLFEQNFNRSSVVLALGGGNVGDVAGFAAANFMRGIPVIQIPTTLLAMVDSSVGGKTGIDLSFGKNLIGAFHNPRAVLIDPDFLKSLPDVEFACGMAEIIKHAIIGDRELFSDLEQGFDPTTLIERAVQVKTQIVFADPRENNIRANLNLGHTFAHAIEKVSDYQIKHGQAVAIGLMLATKLAHRLGYLKNDFSDQLEKLLKKYHLPTELPSNMDKNALIKAMLHDKKRDRHGLKFILPHDLGDVRAEYVEENLIF
jgi:shikimate kinase/3-dehydroquinate synthase